MLDSKILLDFRYYSDPTYTDYTKQLGDESTGSATITLTDSNYIYIGFYKPVAEIYFEFTTANTNANTLAVQYYSTASSDWASLTVIDETNGFTENGFLHFTRPVDSNDNDDWGETTIDSEELYWLRIQPSVAHSETVYKYVGLLFSDAKSLAMYNPYINDSSMLMGETTHLKMHCAARNQIIQKLFVEGQIKLDSSYKKTRITGWDVLDKNEIKDAAAYLALSLIYFNLSDQPEDNWAVKSNKYDIMYKELISTIYLTLDKNDDGEIDDTEKLSIVESRMIR
jgi:hypothetical protein